VGDAHQVQHRVGRSTHGHHGAHAVQQCGVSTSDYGVQLALCLAGECGFFCPASLLQPVEAAHSLRIFTVPELQEQLHIECIRTAAAVQPAYIRAFESVFLQVCRSFTL